MVSPPLIVEAVPPNSYYGQLDFQYLSNGIAILPGDQAKASRSVLDSSSSTHTYTNPSTNPVPLSFKIALLITPSTIPQE